MNGGDEAAREAIFYSRWREPFFLAWSLADMTLIALLAGADGGTQARRCSCCS